jgi:hypothetical protein
MKAVLSCLGYIIVSFEFVVCLGGVLVYMFWPSQLAWMSQYIGGSKEFLKYFCFLPIGLVVYDSKYVKNILFPKSDTKSYFQKWDMYFDFKMGCIIGLMYAVFFAALGLVCFFFNWMRPAAFQSAFLLTSILGAVVVTVSFYLHSIKIEEVFRQHVDFTS